MANIPQSNPTPGFFFKAFFNQGASTGAAAEFKILIMANKIAAGVGDDGYSVYGADTETPARNEADVIRLAGAGSPAHRMYREVIARYPSASVYLCFVPESTGSKASGTVSITGTATENATLRVWVGDEFVDASVVEGDTATTVAAAVASAVNSKVHFPVTALASSGTATLTAKCKGLRGNQIGIQAKTLEACGLTVTPGVPTKLSGGTTADSNERPLATIKGKRFYYIVSEANDADNLDDAIAHVEAQASALTGNTQRLIFGSNGASLANAITLATGINHERATFAYQCEGDKSGGELAASLAAALAAREAGFSADSLNHDNLGSVGNTSTLWGVKAPLSGRKLTDNEVISCLNNGITPVNGTQGASTEVVTVITTRSLTGSDNDYRSRDWHIPSVADRFQDTLSGLYRAQLSNKTIAADPAEGESQAPGSVTPRQVKTLVVNCVKDFFARGFLKEREKIIASVDVQIDPLLKTRFVVKMDLQVVSLAHQFDTTIYEVGG